MQEVQRCHTKKWWLMPSVVCLMAVMLVVACSLRHFAIRNTDVFAERKGLLESFNTYWSMRAKKDLKHCFLLEAPYLQEMVSPKHYRLYMGLSSRAKLRQVSVLGMECERPFLCYVRCRLTFSPKNSSGASGSSWRKDIRNLRDCWVRVNGSWYHVLRNPLLLPHFGG